MNLHLINDEKFFDPFVEKLEKLNLLGNNIFIVKECGPLRFIRRQDLVYGRLCDQELIGDVLRYSKVFIHYFSFELYSWVNQNSFRELNWMIWGRELYESALVDFPLYEEKTKSIVRRTEDTKTRISKYYKRAENFVKGVDIEKIYGKIDNVLTWIQPEYVFALKSIRGLRAKHKEFAYTFEYDVELLGSKFNEHFSLENKSINDLKCILGNSASATNNHLDALEIISTAGFREVVMPVSYGNTKYMELLKKEVEKRYPREAIVFMNRFMSFNEYLDFFNGYDIFINNSMRPIGMGNIWIALLLGKIVFMNSKNLVFSYLKSLGLQIYSISDFKNLPAIIKQVNPGINRSVALSFLSTDKIDSLYLNLFGNEVMANS